MTNPETNPTAIAKALIKAIEQKDYDTATRYVAEGCEYWNVPLAKVSGPEGVRGVLEPFFEPTLDNEFIILREAEVGPVVFMERLDRHRLADRWIELPVTGVWEVHSGRVTVWHDYFDAATLMQHWPKPG